MNHQNGVQVIDLISDDEPSPKRLRPTPKALGKQPFSSSSANLNRATSFVSTSGHQFEPDPGLPGNKIKAEGEFRWKQSWTRMELRRLTNSCPRRLFQLCQLVISPWRTRTDVTSIEFEQLPDNIIEDLYNYLKHGQLYHYDKDDKPITSPRGGALESSFSTSVDMRETASFGAVDTEFVLRHAAPEKLRQIITELALQSPSLRLALLKELAPVPYYRMEREMNMWAREAEYRAAAGGSRPPETAKTEPPIPMRMAARSNPPYPRAVDVKAEPPTHSPIFRSPPLPSNTESVSPISANQSRAVPHNPPGKQEPDSNAAPQWGQYDRFGRKRYSWMKPAESSMQKAPGASTPTNPRSHLKVSATESSNVEGPGQPSPGFPRSVVRPTPFPSFRDPPGRERDAAVDPQGNSAMNDVTVLSLDTSKHGSEEEGRLWDKVASGESIRVEQDDDAGEDDVGKEGDVGKRGM